MRRIGLFVLLCLPWAALAQQPEPHWSLRPRSCPTLPSFTSSADRQWVRNAVDAFVLEKLLKAGLRPAPEADARALIRRATFDLTGLPPMPREVDEFVAAFSARPQAAYED